MSSGITCTAVLNVRGVAALVGVPTLTDLGYENFGDGFRHPVKKPKGRLTEPDQVFSAVIRGVHGVAERANALVKVTLKPCGGSASTP